MEQELDKLSDEFRAKIKLPTNIPFEVEGVYAFIQDKSNAPLEKAEFIFDSSSDVKLNVTTYDGKTIIDDPDVKLDNGYEATWVDNPQAKLLRWSDEKNDATYEVALFFREDSGFKKEDLIQIANSMD